MENDDGVRFSAGAPPTATYETPVAPTSAPVPTRRGIAPGIVAVVAIAGLGIGFGAGYAAHGSNEPSKQGAVAATSAASTAATVTMHGSLTLRTGAYVNQDGTNCVSGDGYSDISAGTAVTIGDQTGATVVVTQLQQGQITGNGCEFDFNTQVPSGRASYTVTVSHRGTQVFQPDQIMQANVVLG